MKTQPTVGRTVHYVAYGTPQGEYPSGVHRAAIITQVNNETNVGLCILNPTGQFFNTSVQHDQKDKAPGTWHWIEGTREATEAE